MLSVRKLTRGLILQDVFPTFTLLSRLRLAMHQNTRRLNSSKLGSLQQFTAQLHRLEEHSNASLFEEDVRTFMMLYQRLADTDRIQALKALSFHATSSLEKNKNEMDQRVDSNQTGNLTKGNLFERLSRAKNGLAFLVDVRTDAIRSSRPLQDSQLAQLNRFLLNQLRPWFRPHLLRLERLTWQTPASILEQMIRYEAVHAIPSWMHLKQRLSQGRRCYAFFHPQMENQLLAFVQVAFQPQASRSIQSILEENPVLRPEQDARAAVFYSITTTRPGLSGLSLGHFLLKQVSKELVQTYPFLEQMVTLSPLPGFSSAIKRDVLSSTRGWEALSDVQVDREQLRQWCLDIEEHRETQWSLDETEKARGTFLQLAERYLGVVKGRALLDPVASFHLGNGAQVYRLNWMGDSSDKGRRQSFGLMVNYVYDLKQMESYRKQFKETPQANWVAKL